MFRTRIRTIAAAAALALLLVGAVSASTFALGNLVQTSGSTPFPAECGLAGQTGTPYLNSEVEPWIDVNPTNLSNFVGI